HYLEEAEMLCRNIGIINHGELIEHTSMKALLSKLEMETFILDIKLNGNHPELEGVNWRLPDNHTLEVEINRGSSLNQVFVQLTRQGIDVISMRNKANRLEELFVT
ncbi:ABC transporter ATP-binding protein, partial [Vibrio natriegens]